jgi:hypothetical protein
MTNVNLRDLDVSGVEIVPENIRVTGPIYVSAMLEQLKVFQVVDYLVAAFQNGRLPLKKSAGRRLYQYWRETPQRLTVVDRKNLYTRVFGLPGGEQGVVPNQEFGDLWTRFISSVSALARQTATGSEARATTEQTTRKAGRDLAVNMSLYGYGVAFFAATELRGQVDQIVKLASDPEILRAYGARDMWQVVDQVATLELGGAANSARYRALASSGSTIIAWLAKNARKFSISARGPFLTLNSKSSRMGKLDALTAKSPTDSDLVAACEQWLAVSGTSDGSVDDFSHPVG